MLFHLNWGTTLPVLRSGYLGVDLFFVLSGAVLTHVYTGHNLLHPAAYWSFLRNRLARIYPLHIITLCALGLLVILVPSFADRYGDHATRFSADAFIASALLIQNWAHWLPDAWNVPAWSLSAEWFAYLMFPVILLFAARFITTTAKATIATITLFAALALFFFLPWDTESKRRGLSWHVTDVLRIYCRLSRLPHHASAQPNIQ